MKILLATWNPDKIGWLTKGFEALGIPIEAVDPAACGGGEENGDTCAENAEMKAMCVGFRKDAIVVAEDSGLFLDGLDGFPGTHTARWAPGDDRDRAALLLQKLSGNPDRRARFVSAVCLLFPDGEAKLCEGVMEGGISRSMRGDPSAGYGAIFELPSGQTLSEFGEEAAARDDHRQRAMRAACGEITGWMEKRPR
jgi:XTP/dITP diphosphohydrolase